MQMVTLKKWICRYLAPLGGVALTFSCAALTPETRSNRAIECYNRAVEFSQKSRLKDAEREYQCAIAANPEFFQAHNNLGALYLKQKRLDEAEQQFYKALSINPKYAFAWENLALTYEALEQYIKALETWQNALRHETRFSQKKQGTERVIAIQKKLGKFYRRRWGIVIGIDTYGGGKGWQKLDYAVNDAESVATQLKAMGFDEVITKTNGEATRATLLSLLADLNKPVSEDDLVFIFFAGHGQTESPLYGQEVGYIIPVDGIKTNPVATAISMGQIKEMSKRIPARHIYYVIDACYSGYGLDLPLENGRDIGTSTFSRTVQMMTAGQKDEKVRERKGHGLFTEYLLRGLDGEADNKPYGNHDGFVTATELGKFVKFEVFSAPDSTQHPQYGYLEGKGDIIFVPRSRGK